MKRKFLIVTSTILLAGVLLSSCLNSTSSSVNPTKGGLIIYSAVDLQTVITKDPLYVAFKFNSLLATVAKQKADDPSADITIENVEITPISDEEKEKVKYLKHLFGAATIEEQGAGVWKVTFSTMLCGHQDNLRTGSITIDTKGKMLADLTPESESWDITTGTGRQAYEIDFGNRGTFSCAIENYKITRSSISGYWTIKGKSIAAPVNAMGEGTPADWSFSISLNQRGAGGVGEPITGVFQDYDNAVISKYSLTTYATGKPAYNDFPITYLGEDIVFAPKCTRIPFAGIETVTVTNMGSLDPEVFPENKVKITWKEHKTECVSYYELAYNGYVFSSITGGLE